MGRPLDYEAAKALLDEVFALAETHARDRVAVTVPAPIEQAIERLFSSSTQAFREAVVGCALARILDNEIDVHLPYMNQGEDAFNGRTLDEQVVNPFLQEKGIPCSKGPYLSALRRNVRLEAATATGLRDKEAFAAMLVVVDALMDAENETAKAYLLALLLAFVKLRESADITLRRIARLSLVQYGQLVEGLLATPSGVFLILFYDGYKEFKATEERISAMERRDRVEKYLGKLQSTPPDQLEKVIRDGP